MDTEALKQLVSEALDKLGLSIDSVDVVTGGRTVVAVSTPDSALLIGERGETLQAFNMIARRMAESRFGKDTPGFLIDVNNYHESRLEAMRERVKMLAERAREFKDEVALDPMTSYERLVVHELFAEDPEIETQSRGEGKERHIVLKYKN
ncbi:MAG TPA: R3H domain-containing nucleic acid-binding protein [Candidatus Paceibacterota bacterium]